MPKSRLIMPIACLALMGVIASVGHCGGGGCSAMFGDIKTYIPFIAMAVTFAIVAPIGLLMRRKR